MFLFKASWPATTVAGLILVGGLALAAMGCGGQREVKTVAVSGVVTLDEKPLEGALVRFEPQGGPTKEGWADSSGTTDADGKYFLLTGSGQTGAIVGTHKVSITMAPDPQAVDASTEGAPAPKVRPKQTIPARYNTESELTFSVTDAGTNAANFDLKSK